ncbi:MAG: 30S ribosomal protein S6 [Pseudomonadota bacterium]|nr:30S ribosomal protein S6 [Pseudomonadota bacterium]MDE3038635.1 30S ribosomal protein S6 [Pseudomonadota bacterium]
MPCYETTFIARQDLPRQDVAKLAESLAAIVEQGGGKVVKNEYWGLKSLAYRIAKNRKGHYTMLALEAPPAAVKEMERNMLINEDIVRQLTVRVDSLAEGPSVMMQQSRSRDDYAPDTEVAAIVAVTDEPTESIN